VIPLSIEAAIIISAAAFVVSLIQAIFNMRRANRSDAKSDGSQLTTVIVKLESISDDTREIKSDLRDVKSDLKDHSERLVKVEQQVKVLEKNVFRKED
jgi:septal ring factor EnvC (AmiA/AmiB activator)